MCSYCNISLLLTTTSSLIILSVGFMMQYRKNKAFENKIVELIKAHNDLINNIIPPNQVVHISEPISKEIEDPALYNFITRNNYFDENLKSK